jgi:SAM-dependent methyltransferase
MTKNFFTEYHQTQSLLNDSDDLQRIEWFKAYFSKNYLKYLTSYNKDISILEIGCGRGMLLNAISESGFNNLTGIDLSEGDVELGKQLFPHLKLDTCDLHDFLNNSLKKFDVIILKAVLEHVEKPMIMDLLKRISLSLDKSGIVIIDVPDMDWFFASHERYLDFTHEVGFTAVSLHQVLSFHFNNIQISNSVDYFSTNPLRNKLRNFTRRFLTYLLSIADPDGANALNWSRSLIAVASKKSQ